MVNAAGNCRVRNRTTPGKAMADGKRIREYASERMGVRGGGLHGL